MARKVVALDLDGCMAATIEEVARQLGETVSYEEITHWNWVLDRWGVDKFYGTLMAAHSSPTLAPFPGTVEAIKRIMAVADVYCLTANRPDNLPHIEKWLAAQGIPMRVQGAESSDAKMKASWDILVDDAPQRHHGETGDGRFVWVFRQRYNESASRKPYEPNAHAAEWSAFADYVESFVQ